MPISTVTANVLEFDLDGTIVDSTNAIEKAWGEMIDKFPFLNEDGLFFHKIHGVRVIDVFRRFLSDHYKTEEELVEASLEFDKIMVFKYGNYNFPINGAPALFKDLHKLENKPFCIVTSGTAVQANGHFEVCLLKAGVEKPDIFITADDVTVGKPDPQGYLMGAKLLEEKLGFPVPSRIIFEDAPAGIKAAKTMGAPVIGICSTFDAEKLYKEGVDYAVEDLSKVKVVKYENGVITLEVDHY